jgi:MFS superfamily sulfate permease-like transporter
VVRCESSLVYFNAAFVRERLFEILDARADGIQLVVADLSAVPTVDLAGAELLEDLKTTLRGRGVSFRVANAHGQVRAALARIGFEDDAGPLERQSVEQILAAP